MRLTACNLNDIITECGDPMIESGRSPHIEPIVFFNSLDARKSRTGHHCPVLSSVNHVYSS